MNIKLEIAIFVFLTITTFASAIWIFTTRKRLKRFFAGKEAGDLEEVIAELGLNIKKSNKAKSDLEKDISVINSKLKKSIRGLQTIRFNPFPDQGSNQSFAIALLDEEGDGVVFSSLYSRERMSVFAKPIKEGKSQYDLTTEEKEA
jgi:hypothetical protein